MPCRSAQLLWCCWRRLLLRLLLSVSQQAWQVAQEVVRTPQLREVRWLQQRRQHLEHQALQLAQEEQRVLAQARVTQPSALSGSMSVARREERVRPLAMVKGKGRFLVPALEPSPACSHPEAEVKRGANRVLSYQECNQCQQKQIMPLTPITELRDWNQNLVYIPDVFYDIRQKSCLQQRDSPVTEFDILHQFFDDERPEEFLQGDGLQVQSPTTCSQAGDGRDQGGPELMVRCGGRRTAADGAESSDDRRPGRGDGGDSAAGSFSVLRCVPRGHDDHPEPPHPFDEPPVEVRQREMRAPLGRPERPCPTSIWHDDLPTLQQQGDDGDQRLPESTGCGDSTHGRTMRPGSLPLRNAAGLCQDGEIQHQPPAQRLAGWMSQMTSLHDDSRFQKVMSTLDLDQAATYVTTFRGECVRGVSPIITRAFLSRKVILTKSDDHWNAVHVSQVPGEDYNLGMETPCLILYEFMPEFLEYLTDSELYENETTLAKSTKGEINEKSG